MNHATTNNYTVCRSRLLLLYEERFGSGWSPGVSLWFRSQSSKVTIFHWVNLGYEPAGWSYLPATWALWPICPFSSPFGWSFQQRINSWSSTGDQSTPSGFVRILLPLSGSGNSNEQSWLSGPWGWVGERLECREDLPGETLRQTPFLLVCLSKYSQSNCQGNLVQTHKRMQCQETQAQSDDPVLPLSYPAWDLSLEVVDSRNVWTWYEVQTPRWLL